VIAEVIARDKERKAAARKERVEMDEVLGRLDEAAEDVMALLGGR